MGREEPLQLDRVEVGNEECDMSPEGYPAHYDRIASALEKARPNLTVVASGFWNDRFALDGHPCTSGQRCDEWDEHFYRAPQALAAMFGHYDTYNRSLPKVLVVGRSSHHRGIAHHLIISSSHHLIISSSRHRSSL